MNFSIKNTLLLGILFFTCSFIHGAETVVEDPYPTEYQFSSKEDYIKVKITLPVRTMSESTLYKINNPDPKGVSVRINNDQLECSEIFYQLIDIEVHAVPSHEEEGVTFVVIKNLERIPTDGEILTDKRTRTTEYFVKTDKQVNFRNDVIPKLTFSRNSPNIKYLRFFTKP